MNSVVLLITFSLPLGSDARWKYLTSGWLVGHLSDTNGPPFAVAGCAAYRRNGSASARISIRRCRDGARGGRGERARPFSRRYDAMNPIAGVRRFSQKGGERPRHANTSSSLCHRSRIWTVTFLIVSPTAWQVGPSRSSKRKDPLLFGH